MILRPDRLIFYKGWHPVKSAISMMPNADMELPYEGAKEMLLVDELPAPKAKKLGKSSKVH